MCIQHSLQEYANLSLMRETNSRQVNMQVLLYKEIIIECSILVLFKWFLSPIYSQRSPLERCKKFGAVRFDFVTAIALFPKLPSLTVLWLEVSPELLLQAYLTCKNQTVIQRHLDSFLVGYTYIWPMLIILAHVKLTLFQLEVSTELLTQEYLRPDGILFYYFWASTLLV